jgi:hypothetical protein
MRIAVIDGQGGGIGKALVERLRAVFGEEMEILALGTNALATTGMLRAGANEGASGEYAIVWNVPRVDVILGSIGIIASGSMLGELTPAMARGIAESPARKILIPLNRCGIRVAGVSNEPLPHAIESAIGLVREFMQGGT